MLKELLQIPNLLSISRILLTPVIGYFLYLQDDRSTLICVILLIVAGITDGLDGFAARKMNLVSDLGKTLDPVADKIFAGITIVLLILFRDFPLWMAFLIIGRDLAILIAGFAIMRNQKVVVSSNLTGKYTFAAIAFLMGSYVLRFTFGIYLCSIIVIIYTIVSIVIYARMFIKVKRGDPQPVFKDKMLYKIMRVCLQAAFLSLFFYNMFFNFLSF